MGCFHGGSFSPIFGKPFHGMVGGGFFFYSDINPFRDNIYWYGRYIDDIFIVWEWEPNGIQELVNYSNTNHFNL